MKEAAKKTLVQEKISYTHKISGYFLLSSITVSTGGMVKTWPQKWKWNAFGKTTDLSETERQKTPGSLYHIQQNQIGKTFFCELHGSYVWIFFLLNSQKWFAFVEYGTRSQEFSVFLFLIDL